jgi:hypothetical protein
MNDVVEKKQRLCLIYGLFQHLPTGTEENKENRSQDSLYPSRDSNQTSPEYKPRALPLENLLSVSIALIQIYFTILKFYLRRRELTILGTGNTVFFWLSRGTTKWPCTPSMWGLTLPNDQFHSEVV